MNPKPTPRTSAKCSVIQRAPPLYGEPEWVVYLGGETVAEAVAVFFNQMDAQDYSKWKNENRTH